MSSDRTMYKIIGISMLSLLALIVIPASYGDQTNPSLMYGAATLVVKDASGNVTFEQTVHNRLVDAGENYINDVAFRDGASDIADGAAVSTICLYVAGGAGDAAFDTVAEINAEGTTAANFDAGNAVGNTECQVDGTVVTTTSTAVVNPPVFTGGTHTTAGQSVDAIAVCQAAAANADGFDFSNCATNGILFAVVDTSNVVLASTETVNISYTFDLTSASN